MRRALLACGLALLAAAPSAPAASVVLRVHDAGGARLSFKAFRAIQENGNGSDGDQDQLADRRTLAPIAETPLYDIGGDPGFDWPGRPVTLAVAWPGPDGFEQLMVDIDAPGIYDFDVLTARQAVSALDAALRAHPLRRRPAALAAAMRTARAELGAVDCPAVLTSARMSSTGQEGTCALHAIRARRAAQQAMRLLLAAAGRERGRSAKRQRAVTFDRLPKASDIRSVVALFGRGAWVRLVFDRQEGPGAYRAAVAALHRAGLRVLGEIADSSDLAKLPQSAFEQRVRAYVDALGDVDEWEVGNEVNLRTVGAGAAAKVAYATRYVDAHTKARTLLTLAWQMGEDAPSFSTFGWLAANKTVAAAVDDVGLSLYPDQNPLGASLDRVMRTLHRVVPGKRILITELGSDTPDGEPMWPVGSRADVASYYQAAVNAFSFSGGGAYWWYFLEEARRGNALWRALYAAARP